VPRQTGDHEVVNSTMVEIKQGNDTEDDQLHLDVFSPKCMTSLKILAPAFEENDFIPYTIVPVYMYNHNLHLLWSDELVYPLFYSKETRTI
jgi:hypothetical protein